MTFSKVILTKSFWINVRHQQFLAGLRGPLPLKLSSDNTLQYIDIISQQFKSRITYVVLLYKTEMIRCPFLYDTNSFFLKKAVSCLFRQVYLAHSNSLAHELYRKAFLNFENCFSLTWQKYLSFTQFQQNHYSSAKTKLIEYFVCIILWYNPLNTCSSNWAPSFNSWDNGFFLKQLQIIFKAEWRNHLNIFWKSFCGDFAADNLCWLWGPSF